MNRTHAPQHPLRATRWPVSHQRRHRSVHPQPEARWAVRAACAVAIGGVLALGVWRPPAPVDVDRLAQVQDERVCAFLDAITTLALVGIGPPTDPTPEDMMAVARANAQLAQVREHVRSLDGMDTCR